jgi:sulfur-oxidizing protein SoxZ
LIESPTRSPESSEPAYQGNDSAAMSSLKIRAKHQDGLTSIHVLIDHPMETGRRQDEASGLLVPAHYIEEVRFEHNGKRIATCRLSTAVSKNPYLSIRCRDAKPGDRITVSWMDNLGQGGSGTAVVA